MRNIFKVLREKHRASVERREAERIAGLSAKLEASLRFIKGADNRGLQWRMLMSMPGVCGGSYSTGWTCYVGVTMEDGFDINGSGFGNDFIYSAAGKVAARIREINGIPAPTTAEEE